MAALPSLLCGACAVAIALGLKWFYSRADATDLLWVLAPASWLAGFLGGLDLVYEEGAGFIIHEHRLVVGPSCAGVNFLVIAFLCLYFSFGRYASGRSLWLLYSLVTSFGATVVTNSLRIVVSAHLWSADIYGPWMNREQMHLLAGVAIYYASLVALYLAVASRLRAQAPAIAPLCWYLGIFLGVPLASRMFRGTPGLTENAVWVVAVVLLLTLVKALPFMVRNRINCRT
jgi:exosortase K